jgi:hypothetical protein
MLSCGCGLRKTMCKTSNIAMMLMVLTTSVELIGVTCKVSMLA